METFILYCALEKNIAGYQEALIREIAGKFGLRKIIDLNVEPHYTLKYWLTVNDHQRKELESLIASFCSVHRKQPVKVGGIAGFPSSVVYTQIHLSVTAQETLKSFFHKLKELDWVTWDQFDGDKLIPHSTIAEDCGDKYAEVISYAEERTKLFDTFFDNITMIKKTGEHNNIQTWAVYKRFYFRE